MQSFWFRLLNSVQTDHQLNSGKLDHQAWDFDGWAIVRPTTYFQPKSKKVTAHCAYIVHVLPPWGCSSMRGMFAVWWFRIPTANCTLWRGRTLANVLKLVQTCIKIQCCELKDHFRADVVMNVTSTSEFLIKLVRFEEVRCTRSEAKTCCNHAAKAWKVHRGDIWEGHAGF